MADIYHLLVGLDEKKVVKLEAKAVKTPEKRVSKGRRGGGSGG